MSTRFLTFNRTLLLTWTTAFSTSTIWSMMNDSVEFFTAPADGDFPLWFKLAFINVPLQLTLIMLLYFARIRSEPSSPTRLVRGLALVTTGMVSVHIVTAFWWHFHS